MAFGVDILRIARLEERRQALGVASIADEAEPLSTGMMCFSGPGSWSNQAMGLGMEGPVSAAELDRLIEFYEARGVEPRLELCPLADETLVRGLADRGFVVRDFDDVHVRALTDLPRAALPPGARLQIVDPADPAQVEAFVHVRAAGFGEEQTAVHDRIERRLLAAPRCICLLAWVGGEPAAAAACEVMPPAGCLFGGTTLEPYRGRGLQAALIAERLRLLAEAGCEFACIGSAPRGGTGRNARRAGFAVMYTKLTMVRPREGLAVSR